MSNPNPVPMAKVDIPNLMPGEEGILLDGQFYVAASVVLKRDSVNHFMSAIATVRWVDESGKQQEDEHGQPVQSVITRSIDAEEYANPATGPALPKEVLLIALGDESALAGANDHIRLAINAAKGAGQLSPIEELGL